MWAARPSTKAGGRVRLTAIRGRSAVRDDWAVHVARRLGELPGPVEGVDDPDPPGGQAALVVDAGLALLGHHRVVGPVPGAQLHEQRVRRLVSGVLQLLAQQALGADLGEQVTGDGGGPGGEGVVVGLGGDGRGREVHGIGHPSRLSGRRPVLAPRTAAVGRLAAPWGASKRREPA